MEFEHQSDPIDLSVAQQEMMLAAQIAYRRPEGPAPTGLCFNCQAPVADEDIIEYIRQGNPAPPGTPRFCDEDCSKDWHKRNPAIR